MDSSSFRNACLIASCIATISASTLAKAISVNDIYQYLYQQYPQYNGITYTAPSTNWLANSWLIQTPNIWGKSLTTYNQAFTATINKKTDPDFHMISCQSNPICQGYATCTTPAYTTDINGNRKALCTTSADTILQAIYSAITSANNSVDLLTLQPPEPGENSFATNAFNATIINALIALANKTIATGEIIQVRFLQGQYLILPTLNKMTKQQQQTYLKQITLSQKQYLTDLVKALPPGNKLQISVASMRSCGPLSIKNCGNNDVQKDPYLGLAVNHGKIIIVDNNTIITGGHNLWGEDYLQQNPVNDLSMQLSGPVVSMATVYANTLWQYTCNNKTDFRNFINSYQDGKFTENCPAPINANKVYASRVTQNSVQVMSVAKLNNGVLGNDADQSEIARVYAFNNAKKKHKNKPASSIY